MQGEAQAFVGSERVTYKELLAQRVWKYVSTGFRLPERKAIRSRYGWGLDGCGQMVDGDGIAPSITPRRRARDGGAGDSTEYRASEAFAKFI